ncbi:unnamed protein product [Caenorhabditis angaria]|uniref:receptor protein-tyrosine kinase n=1 Tax=Caenorhabditis angaria TaxID=860376 RepID=A0A9P1NAV6_9PELO|nr:unnamed protein product [Caenorhabditis angaria]
MYSFNMVSILLLMFSIIVQSALIIRPNVVEAAHGVPPRMRDVETKFRIPLAQKQFKIVCPIISTGKDNVMIQWSKNGEQLDWDSRYKISKDGKELKMKSVKFEDSGRYQCQATNGFGHKTIEFIVHVHDENDHAGSVKDYLVLSNSSASPSWLIDMNNEWRSPIKINTGGKLELNCPAQGNPLPEIKWYQNDVQISEETHKHISSMRIEPAAASNSGVYRCVVENSLGSLSYTFEVSVGDYFDPPTTESTSYQEPSVEPIIDQPYNISVYAGHTAQFQCKVKSAENTLIKWLKEVKNPEKEKEEDPNATIIHANGMHLLVLDHIQTETIMPTDADNVYTNRLTISKVQHEHAGKYICVVTSAEGHIVYKAAELKVLTAYDFSFRITADSFFLVICPVVIIFIVFVIMAIIWLKKNQEPNGKLDSKPPPPPRMPPPAAPQEHQDWTSDRTLHSSKPLLLNNSMFQANTSTLKYHAATMDRNALHRTERRFDEMSNVYDNSTVQQPYWTQQRNNNNSIYNGGYRTLDVYNNHRNYPTSDDYSDHDHFFYKR